MALYIQTAPNPDDDEPEAPRWVQLTDLVEINVLPREFWDRIEGAIGKKCKAEDVQRRRAAGLRT